METKPRVSVISPVYKVAAVLPRFIESVLAQTDPDFEFILVCLLYTSPSPRDA